MSVPEPGLSRYKDLKGADGGVKIGLVRSLQISKTLKYGPGVRSTCTVQYRTLPSRCPRCTYSTLSGVGEVS
jgi:hypothetical protein